jgi:hypothetical protein
VEPVGESRLCGPAKNQPASQEDMMPPAASMTETIARAIALTMGCEDWRLCVEAARAAVKAMREPTHSMLEAALPDMPDWGYLPEDWRAMIDHVAEERVFPALHG